MKSVVEKVWMSIDRKGQSLAKNKANKQTKSLLRAVQADKTEKEQEGIQIYEKLMRDLSVCKPSGLSTIESQHKFKRSQCSSSL